MWILYLRTQSIRNIHFILEQELKTKGRRSLLASRNISQTIELLESNQVDSAVALLKQNLQDIKLQNTKNEPDSLYGKSLSIAVPYFAEFLHDTYHTQLTYTLDIDAESLRYELQANLYKIIYEAITCAVLNGDGRNFQLSLKEFKGKLWLTINDDEASFSQFNNKVSFNMSMYYIRQIANKYKASINTFEQNEEGGSQLVISFPMIENL